MRREDLERLHAWDAPLVLQRAVGDERVDRVEELLVPYDGVLEWRWAWEKNIPRTARRERWWDENPATPFFAGAALLVFAVIVLVVDRSPLAFVFAGLFLVLGVVGLAMGARYLARAARWYAVTPTRLLVTRGSRVDVYRWEGFAPVATVFLARGVGCIALTWRGPRGELAERVELRGVVDPQPLATALEARIRQAQVPRAP